jgi:hypothetical protein
VIKGNRKKYHAIVNRLRVRDRKRAQTGRGAVRFNVVIVITGVSEKKILPSESRRCPLILLVLAGWTHNKVLATAQIRVMVSGLLGVRSRGKNVERMC